MLDANFYGDEYLVIEKEPDKVKIEKHYYYLNKLIKNLSNMYKKKIVVCIHPKDNLELKIKYFPNFEIVQYETSGKYL